jgi:AP endonuclease-2
MGFFKPKSPTPTSTSASTPNLDKDTDGANDEPSPIQTEAPSPLKQAGPAPPQFISKKSVVDDIEEWDSEPPAEDGSSKDRVHDPIVAKESWSKLLGKRVPPKCEHNEPCISLLTKKPGVNCGGLPSSLCSPFLYRPRPSPLLPCFTSAASLLF